MSSVGILFLDTGKLGYPELDASEFLLRNPQAQRKFLQISQAVLASWPKFNAPQYFQGMTGKMAGFQEFRIQISNQNVRLFTRLIQREGRELLIVAVAVKPRRTGFDPSVYSRVLELFQSFAEHPDQASLLK